MLFLDLVFPSFCISCQTKIKKNSMLCEECIYGLVLSEPIKQKKQIATTFEEHFISRVFVTYLKKQKYPGVIETAAAYMALQHTFLKWPIPKKVITCTDRSLSFILKKKFKKFLGNSQEKKEESVLCLCIEKNMKVLNLIEQFEIKKLKLRVLSLL